MRSAAYGGTIFGQQEFRSESRARKCTALSIAMSADAWEPARLTIVLPHALFVISLFYCYLKDCSTNDILVWNDCDLLIVNVKLRKIC